MRVYILLSLTWDWEIYGFQHLNPSDKLFYGHLSLDDYKMILENHEKHLIFRKCLNCNLSCFSFLIPEASRSAFGLTYSWSSEFYGSIVNIQHEKCQIWMMYGIKMEEGENYGINYFHNFDVFNHFSHFFKMRNKQKMSIKYFWLWVFIFKIYKSPSFMVKITS